MRKKHCVRCLRLFRPDQLYRDICYGCLYQNNIFPTITVKEIKFDRIESDPFILVRDEVEDLVSRISVGKRILINSNETNRLMVKVVESMKRISMQEAKERYGSDGDRTVIRLMDIKRKVKNG